MNGLIKNCIIARSGIYQYTVDELPKLGLSVNDSPSKKEIYNIYRPSIVLEQNKNKFTRVPIALTHPNEAINPDNYSKYAVGSTGDSISVDYDSSGKEVNLRTSMTIMRQDALDAYNSGVHEMSPGYNAHFKFESGKSPNGEDYDIIMDAINDVNHNAIVPSGRGGSQVKILDSKGGNMNVRKIMSGLWLYVKRKTGLVTDTDMGKFRESINEIVKNRASLSDQDFASRIDGLKAICADMPDSDEKEKLYRFIDDFKIVKEKDDKQAEEAANIISDLFEKLDTAAMTETEPKKGEAVAEEKKEDMTKPETKDETKKEEGAAGETGATNPEEKKIETKDAELSPDKLKYIVSEVVKEMQRLMTEEEGSETKDDESEIGAKKEEVAEGAEASATGKPEKKETKVTTDANFITATFGAGKGKASAIENFWNGSK